MRAASRIAGVLVSLAFGVAGYGQAAPISGQVISQYGQPLPYAQVRICSVTSSGTPCTPPAAIYYDYGLTMPASNPFSSDSFGNYSVYVPVIAAPNLYVVQVSPTSGVTWSYVYPGPSVCPLTTGCTYIGPLTATIFNATTSPYFEVNGTQFASTNLLDTANIAYLANQNTFTGNTQTAPVWNATTGFKVGGVALSSSNLSDGANLAKLNASNTFTGSVQAAPVWNASTGFEIGGSAASNHVLLGNGTNYVDSASIPYSIISGAPTYALFAGAGIPYATSTTAATVATSAQLVTALNTGASSTFVPGLLPEATTSAFGVVKPDGTSITIASGVISAPGTPVVVHSTGKTFNTLYQNTYGYPILVTVTWSCGCTSNPNAYIGSTSSLGTEVAEDGFVSTSGGSMQLVFVVPTNWYYQANEVYGETVSLWIETVI